jgi:FecR protein
MNGDSRIKPPDGKDLVERLLRAAGPRPVPDERLARRVRAAVHDRWLAVLDARRVNRGRWLLAAAIVVAAVLTVWAVGGKLDQDGTGQAPVPLAAIESVSGAAWIHPPHGGTESLDAVLGARIDSGWVAETGEDGHLALRLQSGAQVRLDVDTAVRWFSPAVVVLGRGGLYADSGDRGSTAALTVRTPQVVARDLGTRFEVRFEEGKSVLRVRDGEVVLSTARTRKIARRGDELTFAPGDGLRLRRVPVSGKTWEWVLDTAPPFALEGSTLEPFLTWVSRETGWEIRFSDAARRRALTTAVLHGSLSGVRPDEAPASVFPALGLTSRLEDGVLVVEAR